VGLPMRMPFSLCLIASGTLISVWEADTPKKREPLPSAARHPVGRTRARRGVELEGDHDQPRWTLSAHASTGTSGGARVVWMLCAAARGRAQRLRGNGSIRHITGRERIQQHSNRRHAAD